MHLSDACFVSFFLVQKKRFCLFFTFFCFLVSPFFLSFLHHSKKKLFCATLCSPCVFFRRCPFSSLREEEESVSRFERRRRRRTKLCRSSRVRVIGKAALFFLKTGEKKKEAFPREFH